MRMYLVLILASFGSLVFCQFASIFDKSQKAENCQTWSEWGNCIWVKGAQSRNKTGYFAQLSDECRNHSFYKNAIAQYGRALENVYGYLKEISLDQEPCGMCSYRQSCGTNCDIRKRGKSYINKIFVAEERCMEEQLNGGDQYTACVNDYEKIPKSFKECQVWPNKEIPLPNVSDFQKQLIYAMPMFNCVKATNDRDEPVCRCCCAPYVPSAQNEYLCLPPKQ